MDDFVTSNLYSSRDEWTARLVTILTPHLIEGIKSIFNESYQLCVTSEEPQKYLLCFQNLLCQVPKWNANIIEQERLRIIEKSGCNYMSELLTCVHVIQLKLLTCIRVGNKQKKIDISIPPLDNFLHKVYIHIARKVYTNVYLFEKNISPLLVQKNARELEIIVQECILITVRDSIPTESIIRAYLDESIEQEEEVTVEPIPVEEDAEDNRNTEDVPPGKMEDIPKEQSPPEIVPSIQNIDDNVVTTRLSFNETNKVVEPNGTIGTAPMSINRLQDESVSNAIRSIDHQFKNEEMDGKINISNDLEELELDTFDFETSVSPKSNGNDIDLGIEEFTF